MILSLGVNLEEDTPPTTKLAIHAVVLLGTLLVLALFVGPLVRNAYVELRQRRVTIEWLFLLTMVGALGASLQSMITQHGPVYFEVVSVLLVVYSLGKALGARFRANAMATTDIWAGCLNVCRLVDGRNVREINTTTIQPGNLVEVRPGEVFAVDGIVRSGVGYVSEIALRGEPFPVVKRPGDQVYAGAAAHDATFRIEATTTGTTRHLDQLLAVVEAARRQPLSIQGTADRLATLFVPLIVTAATLTFVVWLWRGSWTVGLFNAMSVLLVACPCALGLATPIVVWSALGRLAERGLVVRSGALLERLATITHVVVDKTGTLTSERLQIVDLATAAHLDRTTILTLLACVQEQSSHPIARALAALPYPAESKVPVTEFRVVPGCGIDAVVAGQQVRIGRPEWLALPADELVRQLRATGQRVDCALNGEIAAIIVLQERLRPSATAMLDEFRTLGLQVDVLTGDTSDRAHALGLPNVQGSLLPDDKRRLIQERQAIGAKVLMVGDGINDAAALAVAEVGIALSTGTDLANQSADATLYHDDLLVLPWAIALARQALQIVRRNLWLAATYNVIGMTLAALGLLHPVVAALLMVLSSALVITSAARVGVHVGHPCPATPVDRTRFAQAFAHGCALLLQALIVVILFNLTLPWVWVVPLLGMMLGALTASAWYRWAWSHQVEMAYIMLTFGNLGMIGGWWADAGFRPLHGSAYCDCATALFAGVWKPWMWVGMYLLGNLGMAFFTQHRHPNLWPMYSGGNLGMGFGMFAGGWLAAQIPMTTLSSAGWLSLLGMTIGMILGMWLGTVLATLGGQAWRLLW